MDQLNRGLAGLTFGALIFMSCPITIKAQSPVPGGIGPSATAMPDGQHSFDSSIGTWKTHITRLQRLLTGSTSWIKMEGTKTERQLWNGQAHLEEIEADGPTGHFEWLTLLLYNPKSHQWSQSFGFSGAGSLEKP